MNKQQLLYDDKYHKQHLKNGRKCVFLSLFIHFERKSESKRAQKQGRGGKKGIERIPSRLCVFSMESDMGFEPMN